MQWRRMPVSSHHCRPHLHAGRLTHPTFSWLQRMSCVTALPSLPHHPFLLSWIVPTSIQTYSFSSCSFKQSLLTLLPPLVMVLFLSFISEQSLHKNCVYLQISVIILFWISFVDLLIPWLPQIYSYQGHWWHHCHWTHWSVPPVISLRTHLISFSSSRPTLHLVPRTPCWHGCLPVFLSYLHILADSISSLWILNIARNQDALSELFFPSIPTPQWAHFKACMLCICWPRQCRFPAQIAPWTPQSYTSLLI